MAKKKGGKKAAKQQGRTISELFTESVEIQLAREQQSAKKKVEYKIQPVAMGVPTVDPGDRDALYRALEE